MKKQQMTESKNLHGGSFQLLSFKSVKNWVSQFDQLLMVGLEVK